MASIINAIIPEQNFEKILDRIGEILTVELDRQATFTYDAVLEAVVHKDRAVAFGHTECPAVNVIYHSTEFSEQSLPSTQGVNLYHIDCIVDGESEDGDGSDVNTMMGDILAKAKLNKLMGVIRAILEDPKYKTLGFQAPSIGNRHVVRMYFLKAINQDARNVRIGRIEFSVKAPEYPAELITPVPIGGNDTTVKLALTETGYIWTLE